MKQECPGLLGGSRIINKPQNTTSDHDKPLKKLNMDFVISDTNVMTVTTEAGPRLKHRKRAEYKASIYDAPKKRLLNMYRTQIPPATALKDQVMMSNGQLWGYLFDYPACRVKLYTVAEGEEYTNQTLGVDYRLEDWQVFRKVVCPELRVITKGYSLFTGYETHWEGALTPQEEYFIG